MALDSVIRHDRRRRDDGRGRHRRRLRQQQQQGAADTSGGGSGLSGEIAGAGSSAQEAAQEAWTRRQSRTQTDATVSLRPGWLGRRSRAVHRRRHRLRRHRLGVRRRGADRAQKRCGGAWTTWSRSRSTSRRSRSSTTCRASTSCSSRRRRWRRSSSRRSRPGTTRRSPPTTRARRCPARRSRRSHRSDESGTTENFTDYLAAWRRRSGPTSRDDTWPVKGGESAQGTSGVVDAVKAGEGTIGYADESQAGDLGIANDQGRRQVRRAAAPRARPRSSTSRQGGTDPAQVRLHLRPEARHDEPRASTRSCSCPTRWPARTYDDANTAALVKGYLNYIISPEGQEAAARPAPARRRSAQPPAKIQPAVDAIGSLIERIAQRSGARGDGRGGRSRAVRGAPGAHGDPARRARNGA